jgi:hypothetical protein
MGRKCSQAGSNERSLVGMPIHGTPLRSLACTAMQYLLSIQFTEKPVLKGEVVANPLFGNTVHVVQP